MALVIRGTKEFFESGSASPLFRIPQLVYQGATQRRHPQYGQQWVLYFQSPAATDESQLSAAQNAFNLVPAYFSAEIDYRGPVHFLTVACPDEPSGGAANGIISTDYELLGNEKQIDIRLHPNSLALGYTVLAQVEDKLTNPDSAVNIGSLPANAQTLYNLLKAGNGQYPVEVSQYVFRCNRIAVSFKEIDVGYGNVNRIYTTQGMITETGGPSPILRAIADAETSSRPATIAAGHAYGWLKKSPTVQTIGGSKTQITSEYWLGLYPTLTNPLVPLV
jgi:hypothetical protein